MDGRFSQLWDFRAKTRPTTHSVAFVSMLNFSSYLSHDDLSCGIQRNLAHQILALAFKMLMAASAALCFASFLLVPSPELKMGKERSQSVKRYELHSCRHSAKQSHRTCACYWSHPPPHVVILLLYSICPANTSKSFLRVLLIWVSAYVYKTWLLYWLYYIE